MIMKKFKNISIVLFITLLHNLFLPSCTDKKIENVENTGNNSDTGFLDIIDPVTKPAVSALIYEGDFSNAFPNPERGYYKRSEITGRNDFTYVKDLDITIVHSYIPIYTYLGLTAKNPWNDSISAELPESLVEDLQTGLDAVRSAGLKTILRPAYAWDWTPPIAEHWDIVKNHIAQINSIISKNADVVMGLEAGILGPWGEWHSDGIFTESNARKGAEFRYELFKYILDTTPDNIPVRLRYPYFIKEMLYLGVNPPEGQNVMTQAQMDRIGYHDDSFMTEENDWGSYNPREIWWGKESGLPSNHAASDLLRNWMYDLRTSTGANIFMGGETEWANDDTVRHENSIPPLRVLTEMANLHTTEISTDYNPKHIDLWKSTDLPASDIGEPAESVYDRIERRLGYRLRLTGAKMTTAEYIGGTFTLSAQICNDGFAGIINARPAYIVLSDGKNRYDILLEGVDVRLWQSGAAAFETSFVLPDDIMAGIYIVALWLPDMNENLRMNPDYSVRFANKNTWDSNNGYNKLGELIVIQK